MTDAGFSLDEGTGFGAAARRFTVAGRVQGVGYRAFAAHVARVLHLRGGARNLEDGRVEVVAVGPEHALDRMEAALFEGPPHSRVTRVDREILASQPCPDDAAAWDVEF